MVDYEGIPGTEPNAQNTWREYFLFPALPPLIAWGKRKRFARSFCLG
jgi:hypothetical protein